MLTARSTLMLGLGLLLLCSCSPRPTRTLSYAELAADLTDTRRLADLSTPGAQIITSYDRKGGNDDYNQPLRTEKDGWVVLADLKGPGYVSRFWFTGAENGQHPLRFYFDGERTPGLETTVGDFCGGSDPYREPWAAYDPFCWYSLVPIPHQKRLIVMTKGGGYKPDGWPRIFYQINYNTLPDDTTVASFHRQPAAAVADALAAAREQLDRVQAPFATGDRVALFEGTLRAGQAVSGTALAGPAILRELQVRLELSALPSLVMRQQAMREIHLRIYWDDATVPSVEVPLGDFFGSIWQRRQFQSLYFGLTGETFVSRFPMPFARSARVEVVNQLGADVPLAITVAREALPAWSNTWGYFHAAWRKTTPQQVGQPHVFVNARGRGRFAGCMLATLSQDQSWWMLEGDESIRVDDETFPGWHGTGLEDYFNGGWYYGSALIRPYSGLPFKAQFRTVQYRIQHSDPVSFAKTLQARIERGPDNASRGFMESVAYYYLDTPQAADSQLGNAVFRSPPQDALAGATVMTEINEFERLGDRRGAREYIGMILEAAPTYPYADILRLRLLAYEAEEQGYPAVAERVATLAASTNALVAQQAQDLQWFHADPSHALLGAYCNTPTEVVLDGQKLGTAGDPQRFTFHRVVLQPGRHALSLRARHREYPYWVLATVKTHQGLTGTGPDWRVGYPTGLEWASAAFDDASWSLIGGAKQGKGPPEEPYVFLEPHAVPGMQSASRGIWDAQWTDKAKLAVFRKTFETN